MLSTHLDQTLSAFSRYCLDRESQGRVWVAHQPVRYPPPLRIVAEELHGRLHEAGYRLQVAANEPLAHGAAPCLEVLGHPALPQPREPERLIIVPQSLLGSLRAVQYQLTQFDLGDTSHENVLAFCQLMEQALFLANQGSARTQAHIQQVRSRLRERQARRPST